MSEKQAKRIRQLETEHNDLRKQMDGLERRVDAWDAAVTAVHTQDLLETTAQRNAERRHAKQAERVAALWRRTAYAALIVAIVIEILAILAVHAKSVEIDLSVGITAPQTLPGDDVPAAKACYLPAEAAPAVHTLSGVTVTHYDCCEECCGKTDGITASGVPAVPYYTVAVDPEVIPLGSEVLVDYGDGTLHTYRASDTGSGVKGAHIDLCVSSHEEALQLGRRTATVWWVAQEDLEGGNI